MMKLIEEIKSIRDNKGWLRKWGIFYCEFCKNYVEKRIQQGKKDKSCGCQKGKLIKQSKIKHEESKTKIYTLWGNMIKRCYYIKGKQYKDYGGREITICPEWANDYIVFRNWALNNGYKEGLQINRINNNGNYEPSNCNFVTSEENMRNRNSNKIKTIEKANEIRELYNIGNYTHRSLAKKFNMSKGNITSILNKKTWI